MCHRWGFPYPDGETSTSRRGADVAWPADSRIEDCSRQARRVIALHPSEPAIPGRLVRCGVRVIAACIRTSSGGECDGVSVRGQSSVTCDESSFTMMYREQYPAVRAYAAALTSASDVDDVVAETFAVAWRRCADIPTDWVRGWLLGTVRNVVRNGRRSMVRADRFVDRLSWLQGPFVVDDLADAVVDIDELRAGLGSLSDSDQEVLVLVAWFDLTPESLAVALGVSKNASAVRLHRARIRLRDSMNNATDEEVA